MSNVLVVAEQSHGHLKKSSLAALGAARLLAKRTGGKVIALVMGKGAAAPAEEVASYGVEVVLAEAPVLEHYLAESHAPVVAEAAVAAGAVWVVAAATAQGKDLLPRAAARLGAAMASDVVGLAGEGSAVLLRRPMWAGNVVAEVELTTPVKAFTIRPTEFAPAVKEGAGVVSPMAVSVDAAALRTRFVEFQEVKSERPELTEARVVVAGGRGTKGDFKASTAPRSAPAAPPWTPAGCPTTGRWARPARWWPRSSTSPPASPAPSSTSPA
jgi:electron transfer flavoprotein alpha subunit